MRHIVLLSITASLFWVPNHAGAQQASPAAASQRSLPLVPGTRVRVTSSTMVAPLQANFLEMKGDTAVFIENAAGRGIWSFTLDQIVKLERSVGERGSNRRYIVRGAAVGFGVGAASFLIFGSTVDPADKGRRYNRFTTALVGGAVGAGLGALVGTRFKTERWAELPLPRRTSLAPSPNGGVNLGLRFDF